MWCDLEKIERSVFGNRRVVLHIFSFVMLGVLHGQKLVVFDYLVKRFLIQVVFCAAVYLVIILTVSCTPAIVPDGQIPVIVRLKVPIQVKVIG